MKRRMLIAEDSPQTRDHLRQLLEATGNFEVDCTGDGESAREALLNHNYSFFITDLRMPRVDGMQLVQYVRDQKLPVTVIVLTGYGSVDQAVQAIRLGAYDFLPKPVDIDQLLLVMDRASRERQLQDEVVQLRDQLQKQFSFQNIISKSPRMHAVFELVQNVANTISTVLIEGETGTGKEQVARAIHQCGSALRSGPMVAINCAALPETLLESELFGHEKGAFTTALSQRKGRFEHANGGTLFLDEVGDIPASMQIKLLRVLQERQFERVGGNSTIEVDVRVIGASNRSLQRLVKQGKFREDLFYRLNVVKIDLPPLRERMEDVPLLATHFTNKYARPGEPPKPISPAAMDCLLHYHWPGNIRELENAIERACVTARTQMIEPENLPADVLKPKPSGQLPTVDLGRPLPDLIRDMTAELEKLYLRKALKKCRGNVGRCAKLSGLSRRSISSKLAEYDIKKDEFKREPS
jgi:DNA-binding NtrC family response regulator